MKGQPYGLQALPNFQEGQEDAEDIALGRDRMGAGTAFPRQVAGGESRQALRKVSRSHGLSPSGTATATVLTWASRSG